MLDRMKHDKKDTGGKSSKELLKERKGQDKETIGKPGRPTKYPRTPETKCMNLFLPGDLHKNLRIASATINGEPSMNEIILDILYENLKNYTEQTK